MFSSIHKISRADSFTYTRARSISVLFRDYSTRNVSQRPLRIYSYVCSCSVFNRTSWLNRWCDKFLFAIAIILYGVRDGCDIPFHTDRLEESSSQSNRIIKFTLTQTVLVGRWPSHSFKQLLVSGFMCTGTNLQVNKESSYRWTDECMMKTKVNSDATVYYDDNVEDDNNHCQCMEATTTKNGNVGRKRRK